MCRAREIWPPARAARAGVHTERPGRWLPPGKCQHRTRRSRSGSVLRDAY